MKTIGKIIGHILWIVAGFLMFVFWIMAMSKWLGLLGVFLALVLTPGLVVFPIIFWIVEGVFPAFYFITWGVGIIGLIITVLCNRDE